MKRKILLITCELPPLKGRPVSGGGLRVEGLRKGLESVGHEVFLSVPADKLAKVGKAGAGLKPYAHNPKSLGPLVVETRPDVILVEQWGTATHLPEVDIPVVFDLHGSLSLENAYRSGGDLSSDAFTKIETLAKADLICCPGVYQKNYYLSWWILAGADPQNAPMEVVPVSLSPKTPKHEASGQTRFVFSGTAWPWIDPNPGLEILAGEVAKSADASFDLYLGKPNLTLAGAKKEEEEARYEEVKKLLSGKKNVKIMDPIGRDKLLTEYKTCSCAFDVYRQNPERDLAVTTRTVEYLWSGVPVIYGNYGELAPLIERFNAGFIVDPEDAKGIREVCARILKDPAVLTEMSKNAQKLAREHFAWDKTIKPLADFVGNPVRRKQKRSLLAGFKSIMDGHWEKLHNDKVQTLEESFREEKREFLARIDVLHDRVEQVNKLKSEEQKTLQKEMRDSLRDKDKRFDKLLADREKDAAKHQEQIRELNEKLDKVNHSFSDKLWQQSQEHNKLLKQKEADVEKVRDDAQYVLRQRDETIRELNKRLEQQADESNKKIWALSEQAKADNKQAESHAEKLCEEQSKELEKRDQQLARLEAKFADMDRDYQTQIRQGHDERNRELFRRDETIVELNKKIADVQQNWEQRMLQSQAERQELLSAKDRETEKAWNDRHREVEKRDKQVADLQETIRDLEETRSEEAQWARSQQADLLKAKGEAGRLSKELDDTRVWAGNLESDLETLRDAEEERKRLSIELDDTRVWAGTLEEQLKEFERTQNELSRVSMELEETRVALEEQEDKRGKYKKAKSEIKRLTQELEDTGDWAKTLEHDYRKRLGALEKALEDQEKAFEESETHFAEMEETIATQREHIRFLGSEVERIQADADSRMRELEPLYEDRERLLDHFDHVRRELEAKDRALDLQLKKSGTLPKQKLFRKSRRIFIQYPHLLWLFAMNLLTNFYMEKWQKKHGKQIFPGHKKSED